MAKIVEDIAQLSENIGPRPAGTEEEQQAALYIADELQKSAGFSTVIEDFNSLSSGTIVRTICFAVSVVAILVSIFVSVAAIPCFIVAALAAVIYILELNGKEVISRFFHTGVSQNVVAKYQPNESMGSRARKIILVANYDSDKEDKKYKTPLAPFIGKIRIASLFGLVLAPLFLLVRTIFFTNATGGVVVFFNIIEVVCIILMALPLIDTILKKTSDYSPAANNNAASVGVLLETARTIGNGLVTEEESIERAASEGNVIHGKEAAQEAGVIPEGVEVEYDTAPRTASVSPEESLAAAKAAIMALTGKPVADRVPLTDISSKLVQVGEPAKTESSSVHFEVDESIGKQPLRASVPAQATPRARIAEKEEAQRREEERIIKEKEASEAAQQKEKKAAVVTAAVNAAVSAVDSATISAVAATQAAKNSAAPVQPQPENIVVMPTPDNRADKTPAWAKSAQAKAHANRPELELNKKVSRSRFADTPAAHITDATLAASGATNAFRAVSTVQDASQGNVSRETTPQKPMTELEARLAALHSEIAATEAPHISDEAKAAFAKMGDPVETSQSTAEVQTTATVNEITKEPSVANEDSEVPSVQSAPEVHSVTEQSVESVDALVEQNIAPGSVSRNNQSRVASQKTVSQNEVALSGDLKTEPAPQKPAGKSIITPAAQKATASAVVQSPSTQSQVAQKNLESKPIEKHNPAKAASTTSAVSSTARSRSAKPLAATASVTSAATAQAVASSSSINGVSEKASAVSQKVASVVREVAPTAKKQETPVEKLSVEEQASVPVEASRSKEATGSMNGASRVSDAKATPVNEHVTVEAAINIAEKSAQSATGKTQAIAPIDVSAFLNKEEEPQSKVALPQEKSLVKQQTPASQAAASPILGMESMPALNSGILPRISDSDISRAEDKQVIVLPEVVNNQIAREESKQRAPMAQSNESTRQGTKALLSNMIPRIADDGSLVQTSTSDSFGLDLPSLNEEVEHNTVSATGSFSTVGGTGAFAPVGDELINGVKPEDLYVEDADDSAYDQEYTQTGAFAGPGYVEMPKSRAGRLFGKFRSKKKQKQNEQSVSEWIQADENYEARSVGKARGNWESFRDESLDNAQQTSNPQGQFVDVDYSDNSFNSPRDWNGGGFSLSRFRKGKKEELSQDEYEEDQTEEFVDVDFNSENPESNIVNIRPMVGGAGLNNAEQINQEHQIIQNFRYPGIDTEIWFVALGAENYGHSGMQAFINEHKEELKSATIINLEGLGAGKLTFLESEGIIKPKKVSSRVKRFLHAASEKTKVNYSTSSLDTRMTISRFAMLRGYQAFTLMGKDGVDAAFYGSKEDELVNIDEKTLHENTEFVMAILKSL